jgi:hypothetical protein
MPLSNAQRAGRARPAEATARCQPTTGASAAAPPRLPAGSSGRRRSGCLQSCRVTGENAMYQKVDDMNLS